MKYVKLCIFDGILLELHKCVKDGVTFRCETYISGKVYDEVILAIRRPIIKELLTVKNYNVNYKKA